MKPIRQRLFGAAALLSALFAGSPGPAHAAPPPAPAQGDVFLGVRATAEPGSGESLLVNVTTLAALEGVAPEGTLTPSAGTLGAALESKYGANWHTREDLRWALFASNNGTNPTVAASRAQVPFGTPAAVFPALGLQARGSVATQIGSVTFNYSQQEAITGVPKGVFQVNGAVSASYSYQVSGGTTAFGTLSQWTSIEASFAGGAASQALDFFRFTGSPTDGNQVRRLGTFTINSSGDLTFTAAPAVNEVRVSQINKSVSEAAGTVQIDFTRSGPNNTAAATVTYAITDVSAVAATDYTAPSGPFEVTFPSNVATASLVIPILSRTGFNGNRVFNVSLVSATGGYDVIAPSTTAVTITDTDPDPGAIRFTSDNFGGTSGYPFVTVTLQRVSGTAGAITVDVTATGGTLSNGTDFTYATPTTVTFANGATTATTQIPVSTNNPGTIVLGLSNPTNFSRLGSITSTTVSLIGTTETNVTFTGGIGTVSNQGILGGESQLFRFNLAEGRSVTFSGTGATSQIKWELRDGSNALVASGTGNLSFSGALASGDYSLRITNGGTPTETFSLNLDASNVAKPKPDVSVGLTATATTGIDIYSPAVQKAIATSRRAAPVSVFFLVDNDGPLSDSMKIGGTGGNGLFGVAYNSNAGNVTASVITGTLTTGVLAEGDAPVSLSARITPNKNSKAIVKKVKKGKRLVITYLKKTFNGTVRATASSDASLSDTAAYQVNTTP